MLNEIFPGILKNGKQNHSASNYLIFKSIDPHSYMKFHVSIDNHWIYQYFLVHASKKIPHKIIGTQKLYFYYLVEFEEICTNIKEINY